ncbi:DUF1254 domain-containing protein [Psychromonas aquimarina]|uniref:DUF1254 domain-containing protein n=1 Tax=Psychromonas aquimarina TaxID=444919 RepID=UPI0003F5F22E|nr:DUF1254 domain-containing protein [Psychromonas aquimarina]
MKKLIIAGTAAFSFSAGAVQIPENITTPDKVVTSVGTFNYFDGYLDEAGTTRALELLQLQRASQVFLDHIPTTSMYAFTEGLTAAGQKQPNQVLLFEDMMDDQTLLLTANNDTVYFLGQYDLSRGPVVLQTPPDTLGFIDDARFHHIADTGRAGADKGQGGTFILLPPDYDNHYGSAEQLKNKHNAFVYQSPSYNIMMLNRGFRDQNGNWDKAVANIKANMKGFYLADIDNPPAMQFIKYTGKETNTIHANNQDFYQELNAAVQREPAQLYSVEERGLMESIGIVKGQDFIPKADLVQAAAVANAQARAVTFRPDDSFNVYPGNPQWTTPYEPNPSHDYVTENGGRNFDAMIYFHYYATGVSPAMALDFLEKGSKYAAAFHDSTGAYLDGGLHYTITIPAGVPAKDFWSFTVYDTQTRSMLVNGSKSSVIGFDAQANKDGSIPCTLHRSVRRESMKVTGLKLSAADHGPPSFVTMDRSRPGLIKPGSWVILKKLNHKND